MSGSKLNRETKYKKRFGHRRSLLLSSAIAPALLLAFSPANAQQDDDEDVVVVTGIRGALQSALVEKRNADNLVEVIQAEDIGKLPDQNLAEVLENITGIQITRDAGIGTAVQIRGTDDNRTEINGVSTVGSGSNGRGGIDFEDLPASLIASVEVTKVPEARTIEGSVGGTINLRTLRPLELKDHVLSFRAQGERSDLAESFLPRISGTIGDNWDTGFGEFGIVLSGSYARQDVAAIRPRLDRDAVVLPTDLGPDGVTPLASAESFPFLRIQFLDQDRDQFEFETFNLSGAVEWKPTDNLKFYFDGIFNDQQRSAEGTRVQFSGVSASAVVNNTTNTGFETVDFGSLDGPNGPVPLGEVQAVVTGILEPGEQPGTGSNRLNPNLRTSNNTGSRVTESTVFRLGTEWEGDRLSIGVEGSISSSDTVNPDITVNLDFINPNDTQPAVGVSLDNGVPVEFDLTGGALTFGIAQGLPSTPTVEQLLDPANYQLRNFNQGLDFIDNEEAAVRVDASYDVADFFGGFFTSVDAGYRFNRTSSTQVENTQNFSFTSDGDLNGNTGSFARPNGDLFSEILIPGPDNFNAADGRELFVENFLIIDSDLLFDDPDTVRDVLNAAIAASNAANPQFAPVSLITVPTEVTGGFFDVSETTHALYAQANYDSDAFGFPVRGNVGLRWVQTNLTSAANIETSVNGVDTVSLETFEGSYNFFLPRFNLVAEPGEDFIVRAGVARDINRPEFGDLTPSTTFGTSANTPVSIGNSELEPESVWSFDLSGEYYFAPSSVVSLGFFHKIRTNLFSSFTEFPPGNEDLSGQLNVDITQPCEDGGIFNPVANIGINNPDPGSQTIGICVPQESTFNGEGTFTQTGIEAAFQYSLDEWEDRLGFASGFGVILNYTLQFTGGSAEDFITNFRDTSDGPRDVFGDLGIEDTLQQNTLENLSRNAFNATLFYEKHGLSARARYTWRSSFTNEEDDFFNLFLVNGSRGQLNANISYAVTDNLQLTVQGINLLREDADQFCVNNNALLCFQGLTDRRLTFGANLRF